MGVVFLGEEDYFYDFFDGLGVLKFIYCWGKGLSVFESRFLLDKFINFIIKPLFYLYHMNDC